MVQMCVKTDRQICSGYALQRRVALTMGVIALMVHLHLVVSWKCLFQKYTVYTDQL